MEYLLPGVKEGSSVACQ